MFFIILLVYLFVNYNELNIQKLDVDSDSNNLYHDEFNTIVTIDQIVQLIKEFKKM